MEVRTSLRYNLMTDPTRFELALDKELLEGLKILSERRKVSRSEIIRRLIRKELRSARVLTIGVKE